MCALGNPYCLWVEFGFPEAQGLYGGRDMLLMIFRRFKRLIAAAVGEGGGEYMYGTGTLELVLKAAVWFPTARVLVKCVSAS